MIACVPPRLIATFLAGGLFVFAWLARLSCLFLAAHAARVPWKDLALMYDGHVYVLIARSAPYFYTNIEKFFPVYKNSEYFTGWFPVYPAAISVANLLANDLRVAALLASQLLSSAAVALFYLLAKKTVKRPLLAAFLFCFFPPTWLLTGSLAFVEPAFALLFIAAFLCLHEKRWAGATVLASLVVVTQKSGFLVLAIFGLILWRQEGSRAFKRLPWALAALIPLASLQAYLWTAFNDPWINVRVQREIFGTSLVGFPFQAMLSGLASSEQIFEGNFWLRKALIGASCLFYTGVCVWGWKKRRPASEPLLIWLSVVLLFNVSLGGIWPYYAFGRFMTLAAPAAILLIVDRLPSWSGPATVAALALLLVAAFFTAIIETQDAVTLMNRVWSSGYFESLAAYVL